MHYRIMYPTRTKEVLAATFLFSAAMLHVALMTEQTVPVLFFLQMAALAVLIGSLCAEVCVRMKSERQTFGRNRIPSRFGGSRSRRMKWQRSW